jgi:hypothetical protein
VPINARAALLLPPGPTVGAVRRRPPAPVRQGPVPLVWVPVPCACAVTLGVSLPRSAVHDRDPALREMRRAATATPGTCVTLCELPASGPGRPGPGPGHVMSGAAEMPTRPRRAAPRAAHHLAGGVRPDMAPLCVPASSKSATCRLQAASVGPVVEREWGAGARFPGYPGPWGNTQQLHCDLETSKSINQGDQGAKLPCWRAGQAPVPLVICLAAAQLSRAPIGFQLGVERPRGLARGQQRGHTLAQ